MPLRLSFQMLQVLKYICTSISYNNFQSLTAPRFGWGSQREEEAMTFWPQFSTCHSSGNSEVAYSPHLSRFSETIKIFVELI